MIQIGQEIGQHLHLLPQAELAMFGPAEFAFGDDQVHVIQCPVQRAGITPQLRWAFVV